MKKLLTGAFKGFLRAVYWLMKLLAPERENRVVFLSRQSNEPSLDFLELERCLKQTRPYLEIRMLCRKMKGGLGDDALYFFHILRQMHALATSRVCIIDTYIIPVCVLRHRKSLRVIQIWHAIGTVKKFGYQTLGKAGGRDEGLALAMDMHHGYDAAISGSPAMRPAFAEAFRMEESRIAIAWPPKLDYLLKNAAQLREKVRQQYGLEEGRRVVLYAPTYRRNRDYDTEDLTDHLDFSRYTLIVKGHPARDMTVQDGRALQCREYSASELLPAADIVITDYSAISIEAAALGKAVYLYVYDLEEYEESVGLNMDLFAELPGCVFRQAAQLAKALEQDYDYEAVRAFAKKYAPEEGREGAEKICRLALSSLGQ